MTSVAAALWGVSPWRPARGALRLWRWSAGLFAALADDDQPHEAAPAPHARDALDAAFAALFARYQPPLLDFLYGMTRDREATADLVQDTFLKAYASGQDLADLQNPRAWLYRIATNVALNALRRKRLLRWIPLDLVANLGHVEPEVLASSADPPPLPAWPQLPPCEDIAAGIAEREAVWQVLAELPGRWRAVLLLQTTGGFSVGEIAAQLGLSEANVRKLLYRAKERFRVVQARLDALDTTDAATVTDAEDANEAADGGKGAS
jgi:RNA polymerase sigma-70 factor (ECF subfamily)